MVRHGNPVHLLASSIGTVCTSACKHMCECLVCSHVCIAYLLRSLIFFGTFLFIVIFLVLLLCSRNYSLYTLITFFFLLYVNNIQCLLYAWSVLCANSQQSSCVCVCVCACLYVRAFSLRHYQVVRAFYL